MAARLYPIDPGRTGLLDLSELSAMELGTLVTMMREAWQDARSKIMAYEFELIYLEVRAWFMRKFFEVRNV